jgi:glycosyl transferase family 2
VTGPPAREAFLSGKQGRRGGPLRRLEDRLLDAWLAFTRAGARLDELADGMPSRDVLVLSIYRPSANALGRTLAELRRTRHPLRAALGAMGDPDPALREETVAAGLARGKFANLNTVVEAADGPGSHWVLVVDDDVALPQGFLDRFIAVCEHLDLAIAQPAQTRASHAAWPVTLRRAGSMARETRFVEIGPVTCFRRDAWSELTPFPPLRFGWGLDLHWAAIAAERGWRLGVVDALPVRHEHAAVAAAYSSADAIEEARWFLADHAFVDSRRVSETLRVHRLP